MAVKKVAHFACDHVKNGEPCHAERVQDKIDPHQPMYRLQITLEQISPEGITQITKEDVILCYWDLYYHLSDLHTHSHDLVTQFKEQEVRRLGAMNNGE